MDRFEIAVTLALIIGSIVAIVSLLIGVAEFAVVNSVSLSPEWSLSIVNAITTSVLVVITALQMRET